MRTRLLVLATAILIIPAARGVRGECCGDCNGNGKVAIWQHRREACRQKVRTRRPRRPVIADGRE